MSLYDYFFQNPLPWSACPEINGTAVEECAKSSETAYFWYRTTLDAAPAIDQPGGLKWWIVLCLLLSWIIVFFIVCKGIQSSGKVSISSQLSWCKTFATKETSMTKKFIRHCISYSYRDFRSGSFKRDALYIIHYGCYLFHPYLNQDLLKLCFNIHNY